MECWELILMIIVKIAYCYIYYSNNMDDDD